MGVLLWFNGNRNLQSDSLLLTTSLTMKIKLIKIQRSNGVLHMLAGAQLKGLKCANAAMAGASPCLETHFGEG